MGKNNYLNDKYIYAWLVKFHLSRLKAEGLKHGVNTNSLWVKRVNQAMDDILKEADYMDNLVNSKTHVIIEKDFLHHLVKIINCDDAVDHTIESLYKAYNKSKPR